MDKPVRLSKFARRGLARAVLSRFRSCGQVLLVRLGWIGMDTRFIFLHHPSNSSRLEQARSPGTLHASKARYLAPNSSRCWRYCATATTVESGGLLASPHTQPLPSTLPTLLRPPPPSAATVAGGGFNAHSLPLQKERGNLPVALKDPLSNNVLRPRLVPPTAMVAP